MDQKTLTYQDSETVTTVTSETRILVVGWFVRWKKGPLILTVNESRANEVYNKAKSQDPSATIQKLTVHVERFKEIGENVFKPLPINIGDIVAFRNNVIKEWHEGISNIKKANPEIVWMKVAKKNGIENMSVSKFNQWIMDHMKYVMGVI